MKQALRQENQYETGETKDHIDMDVGSVVLLGNDQHTASALWGNRSTVGRRKEDSTRQSQLLSTVFVEQLWC